MDAVPLMDAETRFDAETPFDADAASHEVVDPERQTLPLVFASPHSGSHYPREFLAASRLDPLSLRRSEDSFVDEIFEAAPQLGAPLIRALFPRAFVDANREPFELDPAMFEDELPAYANTRSPRVAAGLGTIARVVANGADIYRGKLAFAEALGRIRRHYRPYHKALGEPFRRQRAQAVAHGDHLVAGPAQGLGQELAHAVVVFSEQNMCHGAVVVPELVHPFAFPQGAPPSQAARQGTIP